MSELAIFNEQIRRVEHEGEVWYAVVDVIEVLTESNKPRGYWSDMKKRDESGQLSAICVQLKLPSKKDRKNYKTDCANREGILRIVQSIPSPKAEPFKRWLAMTGNRRLDEIANDPIEAAKERFRLAGVSEKEIEFRIKVLQEKGLLTAEWSGRGIDAQGKEILADEIHKGTFEGMTRADHATLKRLEDGDILDDHMTPMELAFSNFGDAATLEEIAAHDPKTFDENKSAAQRGGETAGKLRRTYEEDKGQQVISDKSHIKEIERRRRLKSGDN